MIARVKRPWHWPKSSAADFPDGIRSVARELLDSSLARDERIEEPSCASLFDPGIGRSCGVQRCRKSNDLKPSPSLAADRLADCYRRSQRPDWFWFESRMTYANAVLPHALFDASELLARRRLSVHCGNIIWLSGFDDVDRTESSGQSETKIGILAAKKNRPTINNQSKHPRWWRRHLRDSREPATRNIWKLRFVPNNGLPARTALSNRWLMSKLGHVVTEFSRQGLNLNQGAESTLAYLWTELLWLSNKSSFTNESKPAMSLQVAVVRFEPQNLKCRKPRIPC